MPKSIKGKLVLQQSPSDTNCVCCEGRHVFSRYISDKAGNKVDYEQFLLEGLRKVPDGAEVTITLSY